jgi:hypothetical protein
MQTMTRQDDRELHAQGDEGEAGDEQYDEEVDDPTDPEHPDYDLSVASPYAPYEPPPKPWFMRRLALILVAIVVITGLFVPYLRNIF